MMPLLFASMMFGADCKTEDMVISGTSMQGLFFDGDAISVSMNCGPYKRHDYAVFRVPGVENLVIKEIWGMPGDVIEIAKSGKLTIAGNVAKTPFGKTYYVPRMYKKEMLAIAGKPLPAYLLLGHPGSDDSVKLGLVPEVDIIGIVSRDQAKQHKDNQGR